MFLSRKNDKLVDSIVWCMLKLPRRLTSHLRGYAKISMHPYFLLPLVYCLCLGAYYVVFGRLLQFLPSVFFLAAVPVVALLSPSRGLLKYWTPLLMILLSYEALAGTIGALVASNGAVSPYGLDRLIWGFNLTGWVQSAFGSASATALATPLYELHMALVAFTSVVVWLVRRDYFGKYVTAMALTSYSALATFIALPTAPPWFVGTATNLIQGASSFTGSIIATLNALIESDKFAAFPSLHGAYAIVFCYFMLKLDRRLGFVAIPVTMGTLFSTLYLGQHYMLDLIGGAIYALVPCLVSERFQLFSTE